MLHLHILTMYGQEIFLFPKMSRPNLVSIQPPVWQVLRALFTGVKWLECEADHLHPCVVKVKNEWSCDSTLPYAFMGFTGLTRVFLYHVSR